MSGQCLAVYISCKSIQLVVPAWVDVLVGSERQSSSDKDPKVSAISQHWKVDYQNWHVLMPVRIRRRRRRGPIIASNRKAEKIRGHQSFHRAGTLSLLYIFALCTVHSLTMHEQKTANEWSTQYKTEGLRPDYECFHQKQRHVTRHIAWSSKVTL